MAHVARIVVFPIKSLDGLEVASASVLPSGALANDRRFALVDLAGRPLNGKRRAAVHTVRAAFAADASNVELRHAARVRSFRLPGECAALGKWLEELLDEPVHVVENAERGFPDDTLAPGPTVIGAPTLAATADWFGLEPTQARRRFRANLEIDGCETFWEDRLAAAAGHVVRFRIGEAILEGTNPCQRCVVPSRDPDTGEAITGFVAEFRRRREQTLPAWAARDRFDHFYRLAINTRLAPISRGGAVRVGDEIEILEIKAAIGLE